MAREMNEMRSYLRDPIRLWSARKEVHIGRSLVFLAVLFACVAARANERPNIVFILTDDQRDDAVGYHESPLLGISTPNIDRLAEEGARFTNMFVTSSLCSPSRASFLSGTYAHTHGVRDNFTDYPAELESFPLVFQRSGYQTAYVGKWHMGEGDDSKRPGFDYWVTHKGQGKYYDTTFNVNGERQVVKGYYSQRVTDMALEWLGTRDPSRPFVLIIGHKAPHGPFVPEKKYEGIYDQIPVPYPDSAFNLEGKPQWVKDRLPTWHGIYGPLYGFRKEFPYTPNVRGVRTKGWKYVQYPHGDGGPLRHEEELYDLEADPRELRNLAEEARYQAKLLELRSALSRELRESGAEPDRMPIDQGIKIELPEESIR